MPNYQQNQEQPVQIIQLSSSDVAPKKSVNYFDDTTQASIVKFQQEPDIEIKKLIFVKEIQPAFLKLIENIIFVYKFHTLGDLEILKNDCLSFLFETLTKFDASKGAKAFSYFSVITKNWFIQKQKNYKKKNKLDVNFDQALLKKLEKSDEEFSLNHEEVLLNTEYMMLLKEEVKKWRGKFDKKQEKMVLEAVILLFNNPDLISIYNKKGIYLYIREITGLNTKQVVTNLSKIRKKYDLFKKKYHAGEI